MPINFIYPRPEYPRPERRRGTLEGYDWLNLNGPWQFRFDPNRKGVEEGWFAPDTLEWREQIIVPFCWESLAAWGEGDTAGNDHYYSTRVFRNPLQTNRDNHRSAARYEVGWYRRRITVPRNEAWEGKRVILHIGAADFFTDCWCNGIHLGHHEGGYTPFEFDVTDALHEQDGQLQGLVVLRVEDPMENSEQPVGKQWRWYTTTSGLWQTVYLEPRHPMHIRGFRIRTDIDAGTARFDIQCEHAAEGEIEVRVQAPGAPPQQVRLPVTNGAAGQELKLKPLRLWDPNSPDLYDTVLTLRSGGKVVDTVFTYFGVRKIDFELAAEGKESVPTGLRVNGVARYLRGALYQSYHPDGVYTASSQEVLKNDILEAKRFGFNFLRVHIKLDDPVLLYWADKLGMLLMADFPNFGEGGDTPLGRQRFETMMREGIERDFNHPSIFAWCLFNETWGFGGQTGFIEHLLSPPTGKAGPPPTSERQAKLPAAGARPGMIPPHEWVQDMWELAKKLDPTRLVEDMSVCHWDHLEYYLHCDTDINSWHFYISDYEKAKAHIEKIVKSTFVGSSFNYVPGFQHKGQPLINSEYGGVGALDGDRDVSWSFKFLTNELRRHQQIAAYIYTELHDVEWEYNGFLNYDRTPKDFGYDPRIVNESNALPVDSPPVRRVRPGEIVRLDVASSHFSTRQCEDVTLHWEMGGIDSLGRLHQHLASGQRPIPFPHRAVAPAHTVELRMPDQPLLCTVLLRARCKGDIVAENFVHYFVSPGYPPEREETARTLILRGTPGNWASCQWSGPARCDRERDRAEDCCSGGGHGYFEWLFPLNGADLSRVQRIKVVCEAASHRSDWPQTDQDIFPTTLRMFLNGVTVHDAVLRNHPHDARGVLSYLRGGLGAYGYLVHAFAEGEFLNEIVQNVTNDTLRLRLEVPEAAMAKGGLTVFGAECGRYPIGPTVIVEWQNPT